MMSKEKLTLNDGGPKDEMELEAQNGSADNKEDSNRETRIVHINDLNANAQYKFKHNQIKTSKYTWWSFLPINLYEQFRRIANSYFLIIAILQSIPQITPLSSWSSWVPLIIVLLVTMIKEIVEDVARHKQDDQINNSPCRILEGEKFAHKPWHDITVGNIIKIKGGEQIPADVVILSTSEIEGIAYIETANLDGETNLKLRQALAQTNSLQDKKLLSELKGVVECDLPNNKLYKFDATLALGDKTYSLSNKQVLLRGCTLRNTKWIYGVVVYAGKESKLMKNASRPPLKRSLVEERMNIGLIILFSIMLSVCIIGSVMNSVWHRQNIDKVWYLDFPDNFDIDLNAFLVFWAFLILFAVMVPISLYVTLEVVKLFHASLISSDIEMYDPVSDTPANARTSNLSEELGQIEYIFSDKTGTLTCNRMDFMKCNIAGVTYGAGYTEIAINRAKREGRELPPLPDDEPLPGAPPSFPFKDKKFLEDLQNPERREMIEEFLTILSVCHTVIPEEAENGEVKYQASSPDEAALVTAARYMGHNFHTRTIDSVVVKVHGEDRRFEILAVNEFNSDRKRMSVVVRTPEGKVKVLIKGADSVIQKRLSTNVQCDFLEQTWQQLEEFANDGLRTLCLASRELDDAAYQDWAAKYQQASVNLIDRDKAMDAVAEEIEVDLTLVGSTAIEDKLQQGVPDTIYNLRQANLKIWVLTGDKQETAINIGYACSLLFEDMKLIIMNGETEEDVRQEIDGALAKLREEKAKGSSEWALVINGAALEHGLHESNCWQLLEVAKNCSSVICCRVSPKQKADVVKLVKNGLKARTLAIGDGANDVSMIQAAHIGVGISGQEGMQAVLSSDYAIAQFRFLQKLLLVHGRWSYKRICMLILYSFYKNMTFSMVQFWLSIYDGWSGHTYYDSWYITVYNVIFTSLPIVGLSVLDQDTSSELSQKFPLLYATGQPKNNEAFSIKKFITFIGEGIFHSIIIFFLTRVALADGIMYSNGRAVSWFDLGILAITCVVFMVTFKIALEIRYWTWLNHLLTWASLGVYVAFCLVYSVIYLTPQQNYLAVEIMGTASFWLTLVVIMAIGLVPDILNQYIRRTFFPRPHHIVQEIRKFKIPVEVAQGPPPSRKRATRKPTLQAFTVKNNFAEADPDFKFTGYAFSQSKGERDFLLKLRSKIARSKFATNLKKLNQKNKKRKTKDVTEDNNVDNNTNANN
jgi:phospholipid-transporting ATPase